MAEKEKQTAKLDKKTSNNKENAKSNNKKETITKKNPPKKENKIEQTKKETKTQKNNTVKITKNNKKILSDNQVIITEEKNIQSESQKNNIEEQKEISEKNKILKNNNYFGLREILGIMIITGVVSFIMGYIFNRSNENAHLSNYEKELLDNYRNILNNYYKNVDARDLVSTAVKGMINFLDDPYADYIDASQLDDFNLNVNGEYQGIGIQISTNANNEPVIITVFENSSANQSGLKEGDIIVAIKDIDVSNLSIDEIKDIVTSYQNEEFDITYRRNGEENTVTVKRDNIVINSVSSKIYNKNDKKIGYIKLNTFATNSDEQFESALLDLEEEEIDSLIIDLRDNTGGQLTSVENILSLFVDKKHVIYQMKEKDTITKYYSKGNVNREYPVAILVNNLSASASELMTGTLKEIYDATVIGFNTYGKGTAQEIVSLDSGEQYKFTTKEWLTSEGNSIDGVGVEPNIKIEQSEEYYHDKTEENDAQLQKALEILEK